MTFRRGCFFLLLIFIFSTGTAAAVEEITQDHIKTFTVQAPDGLMFSGFTASNLEADTNNTYILDAYGKIYTLYVNCSKSYGWWTFDLALENPNGTIETTQLDTFAPLATDYDVHLQYYFLEGDSTFDLDIYTALIPLSATFLTSDPTASSVISFSDISASSTGYFDLVLYAVTEEEFQEQVDNALGLQLEYAVGEVFAWTWDMVLVFVGKIPGVGPYLASVLEISAITLDAIIFYFDLLLIEYPETTFLTVESFILASAFCRRGNFWVKINRVCNSHIKLIELFIDLVQAGVNIISRIISAVADAINALKPV